MKTVLIVDDSEMDQYIFNQTLKKMKMEFEIITAFDGQEALDIINSTDKKIDLIMLDINMPGLDGHEFLDIYSEDNTRIAPVVVMLTSSDQTQDKEKALEFQCVKDYLVKPITKEKIQNLTSYLEKEQQ